MESNKFKAWLWRSNSNNYSRGKVFVLSYMASFSGIEIILKNGENHIFESKKIDDWFSVHLCEKCQSEVNCVYNIENGRFQNIRYKCKHCGHEVFINTKDVKEIKSI